MQDTDGMDLLCHIRTSSFGISLYLRYDFINAPADTVISHKLVKFQNGINSDVTLCQGMPTTENNRLWKGLVEHAGIYV